jgi:UDP-N-acetyl-D-glucosamine dehydrogenase
MSRPEIRNANSLKELIAAKTACVGVVGMGYVGLPLAMAVARAGFKVLGFDTDAAKVSSLNSGTSYIDAVSASELKKQTSAKLFSATSNAADYGHCDVIVVCVPTPLTRHREPDLAYIRMTSEAIARHMRSGTLVVLESTTYPGTTTEVMTPILASKGLAPQKDFFVGYSPEREDPGNREFHTTSIPKVVAGDGPDASELVALFYGAVVDKIVPVSSTATAEAVKITENVFRAVNIALVNELKIIYDAMGIDVWEVINAAKTKPFGYQAFYPGPGLGGHCIPIDPFYLTWKAREFDIHTRFIELAGEINTAMPRYVINRLEEALSTHAHTALNNARVLILGLAYKKNVADMRESPTFKLMELLEKRGASVDFHDPHIAVIPITREHAEFAGKKSITLDTANISSYDVILLSTDHDDVDYEAISMAARLIIDTRNRFAQVTGGAAIVIKA